MSDRIGANRIGTLNEKPLHAALKEWYAQPGDQFEVALDGFVIDIVRSEQLIEIQTRSFASMKRKLKKLTETHRVHLVHPIATEKWLIKLDETDETQQKSRRKSPKRGVVEHLFNELVSFPQLLIHPNFTIEVLLIHEEEVRRFVGKRQAWRRRGWKTHERRLLNVVQRVCFKSPADMRAMVPSALAETFTTADLATAIKQPHRLAGKMAYCLREMGIIEAAGKRQRSILYRRTSPAKIT